MKPETFYEAKPKRKALVAHLTKMLGVGVLNRSDLDLINVLLGPDCLPYTEAALNEAKGKMGIIHDLTIGAKTLKLAAEEIEISCFEDRLRNERATLYAREWLSLFEDNIRAEIAKL